MEVENKDSKVGATPEKEVSEEVKDVEEFAPRDPLLELADLKFALSVGDNLYSIDEKAAFAKQILDQVKEKNMLPFYLNLCQNFPAFFKQDEELVASMTASNTSELNALQAKVEDAKVHHGDVEILEAKMQIAHFLARIGDKVKALAAYEDCLEKTIGGGQRIDVVFIIIRLALCWSDYELVKKSLVKCSDLVEKEGDWERRNRLQVYRAINHVFLREFQQAADLFVNCIATFTSTELFNYEKFVFYVVVTAVIGTDRIALKEKVLKSPDILQILDERNTLRQYMTTFHKCDYKQFFINVSRVSDLIKQDRYLSTHLAFYLKEVRIKAYAQFLQSYKSVTLDSMASTFGISVEFLDKELSRFIAANRIVAKIDRISNVIESMRNEQRNELYQSVLKQGDILLNRVQKLNQKVKTA
jgi:26S proteasome regulatory subunit N7